MTKTNQMFRVAMGIAIAGALGGTALAQQSIASFTGISYQQDFDNTGGSGNGGFGNALDFSATGTDYTTLPTGWVLSGSSGNYRSSTGSLSTADHYSYGCHLREQHGKTPHADLRPIHWGAVASR
jgi:hypothetical protein